MRNPVQNFMLGISKREMVRLGRFGGLQKEIGELLKTRLVLRPLFPWTRRRNSRPGRRRWQFLIFL